MVIDTSVVVAIVLGEPDADAFRAAMKRDRVWLISVASVLESAIVLQKRLGENGESTLDEFLRPLPIEIRPVDMAQLKWARTALKRFGRGRHPAKLNFGDCFAYALAKTTGEPLLFKGGDFSNTDVAVAV
ncbi:MAG TPA: type II toxin-antitoxin system VapC family toxin [Bryobacteraceae bacterium]|nr:type II toxin-antitoxin system VapC family toxin [Bryobacteraceae bacterium]